MHLHGMLQLMPLLFLAEDLRLFLLLSAEKPQ